jgi:hypothetical protein
MRHIAKHQVSAIRPQFRKTGSGTFGNSQARATRNRNARRLAEFRFQRPDDQYPRHITRRGLTSRFLSW